MIRWIMILLLWISLCIPIGMDTPYFVYAADETSASQDSNGNDGSDASDNPFKDKGFMPPFPGGPVTGQYGEDRGNHRHAGVDIGMDDVTIYAPCDGYVWHKNAEGDNYGEGIAYFQSTADQNPFHINMYILFADLDSNTATLGNHVVKKGDPIGHVQGSVPPSNGAHVHVNQYLVPPASPMAPYFYYNDGVETTNPIPLLQLLGCDLSGTDYSGPNGGKIGSDKPELAFDIEILKTLGDELNKIIKDWSQHAIDAVKNITPYAIGLLGVLCVIDLTLPIILAGMSFNPNELIIKVIKYAGIFGLIYAWPKFINDILLSFITTIGGVVSGPDTNITENVTQPQLLLQKAIYIIGPAFEKIGTFTIRDWLSNFGSIIAIYIITFIVVCFYAAAAISICLIYIEFYISAGLSLVSVPFGSWKLSKFIPEGLGGHMISCALKLLIVSVIVGMGTLAIKDVRPIDIFKVPVLPTTDGTYSGGDPDVGAGLASTNPYVPMIITIANKYNVDPSLALAIAARESGGDNVDDICMPGNGDGIFQIIDGNDGYDPVTGEVFMIKDRFPDYKTNPEHNAEAAMCILLVKINRNDGDIWHGVRDYNGSPQKEWYMNRVKRNYELISGHSASTLGHTGISAPMLILYLKVCLAMITIALLVLILPARIISVLGGRIELP